MKKTPSQKSIIQNNGEIPLFWSVIQENGHFLHIRNWITGEHRVCRK